MKACIMKIKWILLLLAFLSHANQTYPINIKWIRGTYNILKPEFQHLSPVHGAIWWETTLIEKYYNFGFFGKVIPKITIGTKRKQLFLPKPPYSTITLIRELFHTVQGSFNVTHNISSTAYHFSARTIGKICATIEQHKDKDIRTLITQLINIIKKDIDFQTSIVSFEPKYEMLRKQFFDNKAKEKVLLDKQTKLKEQLEAIPDEKQEIKEQLDAIQNQLNTLKPIGTQIQREMAKHNTKKILTEKLRKFVHTIVASLQECSFLKTDQSPSYPPHTTHSILMAFLYRKAEKKSEFKDYFGEFNNVLTKDGKQLIADPEWTTLAFDDHPNVIKQNLTTIESMVKDKTPLNQLPLDFIAFSEISRPKSLPKIAEYRSTTQFMEKRFPDCTETTTRNLCDIACYNQLQNKFDLSNYPQADQTIKTFYNKYPSAILVEEQNVHNDWALIVSNRPFVTYLRIISKESKKAAQLQSDKNGLFIYGLEITQDMQPTPITIIFNDGSTDTFTQITINKEKHILIAPKKYLAFEIQASVRNIIILLNQLLGLKLYKNTKKEFFNADFNAIYFSSLLKKLNWDYTGNILFFHTELKALGGQFSLNVLHNYHAYINVISSIKIEKYQKTMFNLAVTQLVEEPSQYMANLVYLYAHGTIDVVLYKKHPYLKQFAYYLQDLFNPNVAVSMINDLINQEKPLYNFIAALLDFLPIRADLYYHKQVIEKILQTKAHDDKDVKKALDIIIKKIEQTEININDKIKFITHVIDIYPNQAIKAAVAGIKDKKSSVRGLSLKLFKELVKKDKIHNEAIDIASKHINDTNVNVVSDILLLLSELIKKEKNYAQAATLTLVAMNNNKENISILFNGLGIFLYLVKKEQKYNEAIKATQIVIKIENVTAKLSVLVVFMELVKKEQGYNEAIEAVLINIKNDRKTIREYALKLKKLLQEKNAWPEEE